MKGKVVGLTLLVAMSSASGMGEINLWKDSKKLVALIIADYDSVYKEMLKESHNFREASLIEQDWSDKGYRHALFYAPYLAYQLTADKQKSFTTYSFFRINRSFN